MSLRTRRLGPVVALALGAALLLPGPVGALPLNPPKTGMVCLNGPTFDLVATSGSIQTPDGNQIFMWSYADSSGAFQYPGPVLCVTQGQTVTVNLTNNLPAPTSIVFPGQDAQVTASGGAGGLLTTEAAASGGTVSYSFVAGSPGTYLYESGSDISQQIEMGLYGALVVRPSAGAGFAYGTTTPFDPSHEYLQLLSEVDPDLHHAVETGGTYDATTLHNRYFFVNGRAFPDSLQDNGSGLLPTQPYGALVRIQPTNGGGQPALIRMINAGQDKHPYHPHGNHLTQIAQDGRLLLSPGGAAASSERFGETIGSGQTQDYLLRWDDVDLWNPVSNPLPVAQPSFLNLVFKDGNTWYSGNPYLGYKGTLPTGTNSLNLCGEWYFPWHSHALNEFANFDEPFGGMATLLRVDPLGGCFASPTSTKLTAGTLNSGSVTALGVADSTYYKLNSTTTGTRTTDWYGQFSGIAAGSSNLKVTYQGNSTAPVYSQNFNTLASTGTSSTVPAGWAFVESGSAANTTYAAGTGSSTTGNTYSFGTAASDRAFGGLRSGTLVPTIGASFTNTTGATITSLVISYTGEQWRLGATGAADRLDFQYSLTGGSLLTGSWTDFDGLDFASPVTSGSIGAKNGNSSTFRTAKSATITGLSIAPGATYRIRWTDFDRAGSDDGLAIDDFSLTSGYSVPTTVSIWNWATSTWATLAGPTAVSAPDVTVANNVAVPAIAGSWANYIGTGSNKGLVRVRVLSTGTGQNFVTGGNLMKLVYDAP